MDWKLTVADVAKIAGVHKGSVYRWVETGRLKCRRTPGGRVWWTPEDVEIALELEAGTMSDFLARKIISENA